MLSEPLSCCTSGQISWLCLAVRLKWKWTVITDEKLYLTTVNVFKKLDYPLFDLVPTEKHVFVLFWFLFSFKERIKTSHSKFVYFLVFMVLPKRRNTIHNLGGGVDIYIAFYLQTATFETVFRSNLAVWVFQPIERMRTTFLKRNDCRL